MTTAQIEKYIKKNLKDKVVTVARQDYIPVQFLMDIYKAIAKEDKPKAPKLLYMKEFIDAYTEFYIGRPSNIQKIVPRIMDNPAEKNALWSIMRQIQNTCQEREPENPEFYTAEMATSVFRGILEAGTQHKFLKDKLSLHMVNKYFNDLLSAALKNSNLYSGNKKPGYNFDHIN
jgi:hypothetical protein